MKKIIGIVMFAALISCGEPGKEEQRSQSEIEASIEELENVALANMETLDTATALALIKNYDQYATLYPEDAMAPQYLYKAMNYASALTKPHLALEYIDRIIEKYPDFEKTPYCQFLKGFIYEDYLNDLENAEKSYRLFIRTYPDHNMVDAAQFSLRNLGKSPEETLEDLKSKSDSTREES